jgi:hypothetical protein
MRHCSETVRWESDDVRLNNVPKILMWLQLEDECASYVVCCDNTAARGVCSVLGGLFRHHIG